ncbi:MAG: polyisoprenyl-teichoic acid--peptidoglycan teichoic acid transferase [Thermoanaerobacteraceae bacterium]|jgi:LCP family protein required for cell wall assembly|nr:polyisoprenyl-teichoic acid--peptidoglycan teichoic acid transferase [Thermoanaerobacteraceae bacterium]MDN5303087.1 polyisoprenyl-teichoic acid--peptidoglycan teichoic acid transferase [Thermoanaerobacteraceae bacterium]MDN5311072.1 polyisoprenyl-teichoic acid--peptidoglycan teichoic acid transferase [Thermoanaerobacteraceae bacterium]
MKKFFKYTLIAVLFIVLSVGSGFYYVFHSLNKPNPGNPNSGNLTNTDEFVKGGRLNILLLGLDAGTIGASEEHNRHRSDTMMVFSIDRDKKDIKVLSIPRDTRVKIPGVGVEKINAAMAFGGPDLAVKTVKDFLGIPIHNYVVVNYKGFKEIVDALGGVEINIEKPMKYDDNAGNLHIDLKPGLQVLNGDKAEQFVRFRHYPGGDLDRVKAQQKFIEAVGKTILKPSTLLKLPKIINTVQENVETDIGPLEVAGLANFARQVGTDNIKTFILPGEGKYISGVSYFIPFQSQMNDMIDQIFFDGGYSKVAVLNGNGSSGVASKIARELEQKGFKVVRVANADSFDYETTTIIYPKEKKDDAEKIARIFTNAEMKEEPQLQAGLTTVIVGKDIN